MTLDAEIQAALPKVQDWPGNSLSISVMSSPLRCKCQAQLAPTIPAPMITQCLLISTQHVLPGDQCFQNFNDRIHCTDRASIISVGYRAGKIAMQSAG